MLPLPRLPPPPPPALPSPLPPLLFFTVPTNENGKNVLCAICTLLMERQVRGFPRIKMMDLSPLKSDTVSRLVVKDIVDTVKRECWSFSLCTLSLSLSLFIRIVPFPPLPCYLVSLVLRKMCFIGPTMYLSADASGDSISFIVRGDNPIARLHGEIRIDRAWSRQWEREKQQDTYRNGI